MTYVDPYENPAHDRWVAAGHCPVINYAKAWCNLQVGHTGDHASPYVTGSTEIEMVSWTDEAAHIRG